MFSLKIFRQNTDLQLTDPKLNDTGNYTLWCSFSFVWAVANYGHITMFRGFIYQTLVGFDVNMNERVIHKQVYSQEFTDWTFNCCLVLNLQHTADILTCVYGADDHTWSFLQPFPPLLCVCGCMCALCKYQVNPWRLPHRGDDEVTNDSDLQ